MKPLDIVYCKNCKYLYTKKINKDNTLTFCKKNLYVDNDPQFYCNKKCFNKKII